MISSFSRLKSSHKLAVRFRRAPAKQFHTNAFHGNNRSDRRNPAMDGDSSKGRARTGLSMDQYVNFAWLLIIPVWFFGIGRYFHDSYQGPKPMNPETFTKFVLESKTLVSDTSSMFTLRSERACDGSIVPTEVWRRGTWSVEIKQPQLQIARAYTPLPPMIKPAEDDDNTSFKKLRFLIRNEPQGEVSSYLHTLPLGSVIELRGPFHDLDIPEDTGRILFVAGGTGIAPALQVAFAFRIRAADPDAQATAVRILWANRLRKDADALPDLPSFRKCDTQIQRFVDEDKTSIGEQDIAEAITSLSSTMHGSSSAGKLILVSGPDGFVRYISGRKIMRNGTETQGMLDGLLLKLRPMLGDWKLWKL